MYTKNECILLVVLQCIKYYRLNDCFAAHLRIFSFDIADIIALVFSLVYAICICINTFRSSPMWVVMMKSWSLRYELLLTSVHGYYNHLSSWVKSAHQHLCTTPQATSRNWHAETTYCMLRGASVDAICVLYVCINTCDDCGTSATTSGKLALSDPLNVHHSEIHFRDRNIIEMWSSCSTPRAFRHTWLHCNFQSLP